MRAGSDRRAGMSGSRHRNQKGVMPRGWLSFSYRFLRFCCLQAKSTMRRRVRNHQLAQPWQLEMLEI
jgi:hypothetical protein